MYQVDEWRSVKHLGREAPFIRRLILAHLKVRDRWNLAKKEKVGAVTLPEREPQNRHEAHHPSE